MCKSDYLTVEEAATALNTTPTAILMLLRRSELVGQAVAGAGWLVERASLEQLRTARQADAPLIECRSSCAAKVGGCASCGSTAE
jgi:excisionase family DNA binding protein